MADLGIREVRPGGTITLQALGFPAGLEPKPSFRLIALVGGAVVIGPTATGVTEDSPGNYDIQLAIPEGLAAGDYAGEWEFSGVWVRDQDHIVRVSAQAFGAYSFPEAVRDLLTEDNTDPDTAATLTDATLGDAIAQADVEIDAKLGGRYTVPFDPVPLIVARLSGDIAAYLATLTLRHSMPVRDEDSVYRRWARAKELLDLLSSGRAQLPGLTDAVEAAVSTGAVVNPHDASFWDLASWGLKDPLR